MSDGGVFNVPLLSNVRMIVIRFLALMEYLPTKLQLLQ